MAACVTSWFWSAGPAAAESAVFSQDVFMGDASDCGLSIAALPPSGEVPANLPRIELSPWVSGLDFVRQSDSMPVVIESRPFDAIYVREELVVGETYELRRSLCPRLPTVATYVARAAAPLPSTLGTLEIGELVGTIEPGRVPARNYRTEVTLTPDPSTTPWLDYYDWWIDERGATQPAQSLRSLVTTVPVPCAPMTSLDVEYVGRASEEPFTSRVDTPPATRRFVCGEARIVDAMTGRTLTSDEVAELERMLLVDAATGMDAGLDPGTRPPDAANALDALRSIDGGHPTMRTEPDTNGNCSCRVASHENPRPSWALAWLAALVLRRRRRADRARQKVLAPQGKAQRLALDDIQLAR